MKRTQLVSRGTLDRLLREAEEARRRRNFQECTELLQRASRLDPANVNLLLNLGHSYGIRFLHADAEKCFERAVRLSPNRSDTLVAAGIRARDFGDHRMAAQYFERATEGPNAPIEAFVHLAEIHERLSRQDHARELIQRALHLSPNHPPALLVLARIEKDAGHLENAERILSEFPGEADVETRARALYELGAVLDRQKRFGQAMAAFVQAKDLLRPGAARLITERQLMRARLRQMRESISAEMDSSWQEEQQIPASEMLNLAVLCGHPRSGTTLLEQVLDSHPGAISAEETDIFHNEAYLPLIVGSSSDAPLLPILEAAAPTELSKSRQRYKRAIESFLGQAVGDRLLIDKNPYLTYLMAPIIRIWPTVRFLVAVRDPRDVCLSCFMQPFVPLGQTNSAYLSLESTVEEYAELMKMYEVVASRFPNICMEVRYEDLVNDLQTAAKRVLDFLGLPWTDEVLRFDEHARSKLVRSPTYADVTKPIFKRAVGRWKNYEEFLAPHVERLRPFIALFGYD